MKAIDAAGFEAKFQQSIDPWSYRSSPYEAFKRRVLLCACGGRTYGRGLELACAIGENSSHLAPRCLQLLAVDSSPTALKEARERYGDLQRLSFSEVQLPQEMPRGPFDLIVASEIAYYLSVQSLAVLLQRMTLALAPGGRIVLLHHLSAFDDAAQLPSLAQQRMVRHLGRTMVKVFHERQAHYEAIAFRKVVR